MAAGRHLHGDRRRGGDDGVGSGNFSATGIRFYFAPAPPCERPERRRLSPREAAPVHHLGRGVGGPPLRVSACFAAVDLPVVTMPADQDERPAGVSNAGKEP